MILTSAFYLNLFKIVSQLLSSFDFKNYHFSSLPQNIISMRFLHVIFFCEDIASGCTGHTEFAMLNVSKTSLIHAKEIITAQSNQVGDLKSPFSTHKRLTKLQTVI